MPEPSPYAALTLIAAPAVLTNAVSLLALGTSNRFGRSIDRARQLAAHLETPGAASDPHLTIRIRQFDRAQQRTLLLLRSLRCFYLSLGLLSAASLVALLGASLDPETHKPVLQVLPLGALVAGAAGVCFLCIGSVFLVRETRLAVVSVDEEAALIRKRFAAEINEATGDG